VGTDRAASLLELLEEKLDGGAGIVVPFAGELGVG
jgi:hypothetical protein